MFYRRLKINSDQVEYNFSNFPCQPKSAYIIWNILPNIQSDG
jgi:hypothetical protein